MAEERDYNLLSAIERMKPVGHGPFGPIFDQFVGRSINAIDLLMRLKTGEAIGAVSLKWFSEPKIWLLTVFEKKNSVPDNTMNTDETPKGKRNDTATPQNTVSNGKGSDISDTSKEI